MNVSFTEFDSDYVPNADRLIAALICGRDISLLFRRPLSASDLFLKWFWGSADRALDDSPSAVELWLKHLVKTAGMCSGLPLSLGLVPLNVSDGKSTQIPYLSMSTTKEQIFLTYSL